MCVLVFFHVICCVCVLVVSCNLLFVGVCVCASFFVVCECVCLFM